MNDTNPTSKDVVQGPLWIPTPQVERMMRECRESKFDTIGVDRKSLEGLLHDSLLWRQERAARQIKPVETSGASVRGRPGTPMETVMAAFDLLTTNVRPTAWMKGFVSHNGPNGPDEHDVDCVYGDDPPEGDGWIPLYRLPKLEDRPAVEPSPVTNSSGSVSRPVDVPALAVGADQPTGAAALEAGTAHPPRVLEEDVELDLTCEEYFEDPHSRFCDRCGYPEREHKRTGSREKATAPRTIFEADVAPGGWAYPSTGPSPCQGIAKDGRDCALTMQHEGECSPENGSGEQT